MVYWWAQQEEGPRSSWARGLEKSCVLKHAFCFPINTEHKAASVLISSKQTLQWTEIQDGRRVDIKSDSMQTVAEALASNPQLLSELLCLEIDIRPFPVAMRKTHSPCESGPSVTGYYCVSHCSDPFITAAHVNWRSRRSQWGKCSAAWVSKTTWQQKTRISRPGPSEICCRRSICWQLRLVGKESCVEL